MRLWTWVRRGLALVLAAVFFLGLFDASAMAARRGFSSGTRSFSSGSRSFSKPKVTAPKTTAPSRSFSSKPKSTSPAPSRSFSTKPPASGSSDSKGFSSTDSSYSSSSRSFSSPGGGFSNTRPGGTGSSGGGSTAPPVTSTPRTGYDTGKTRYPSAPPVVVVGPTMYDPVYYHDWYWGSPWYWRIWHRPSYSASGGWALSWFAIVVALVGVWVLLGVLSSIMARRRRNRR